MTRRNARSDFQVTRSTPQHSNPSHFGPFLAPRKSFKSGAEKPVTRALSGSRSGRSEPCQGASSGTKNHPTPNDPKLGRLPRARQGLVRVPESNTKYGGKGEKTGVVLCRRRWQLSVSPQGFPRENISPSASNPSFGRCSQGRYLLWPRGCLGETQVAPRGLGWRWCSRSAASHSRCDPNDNGRRVAN